MRKVDRIIKDLCTYHGEVNDREVKTMHKLWDELVKRGFVAYEFIVDEDVLVPTPANMKYPFGIMDVGDSFFVEDCNENLRNKITLAGRQWSKRRGSERTFVSRKEDGGIRFWRTK